MWLACREQQLCAGSPAGGHVWLRAGRMQGPLPQEPLDSAVLSFLGEGLAPGPAPGSSFSELQTGLGSSVSVS